MANNKFLRLIVLIFLMGNSVLLSAQSGFPIRKVGQRFDKYINNQWIGIDSSTFSYNGFPSLLMSENTKGDSLGGWKHNYRFVYLLDANERIIQQTRENWNGSAWVNFNKYNYTYDMNGNLTEVIYQTWNGANWVLTGKIESTGYDSFGLPLSETAFAYNGSNWVFVSKTEFQNTSGKVQVSEKYLWNATLMAWKKVERNYYTYFGNEVSGVTTSYPNDLDIWKLNKRVIYTYNSSTLKLTKIENEKYDTLTNLWKSNTRILYSYTPSLKISNIKYETYSGAWVETNQELFTYNTNDQVTSHIKQLFNGAWINDSKTEYNYNALLNTEQITYHGNGSSWNPSQKITLNYNSDDSLIYKLIEDFNGSSLTPNARYFYYYNQWPLGSQTAKTTLSATLMYPNPMQDIVHVKLPDDVNGSVSVEVYDVLGKKVLFIQQYCDGIHNTISLSTSELKQGIYQAKVIHRESNAHSAMLLIKN